MTHPQHPKVLVIAKYIPAANGIDIFVDHGVTCDRELSCQVKSMIDGILGNDGEFMGSQSFFVATQPGPSPSVCNTTR